MIIGLTGTLRAGKGTLVEVLKENNFEHYSVREFLIEEIEKRDKPVNRDSMIEIANELREKNSPSFIVEQLYNKAKEKGKDSVIESIRTKGEVDFLRKYGREDFFLIAVDAEQKIRYDRAVKAQSETDNVSFEKFVEQEKREMFSDDSGKQNLSYCMNYSDYFFLNNYSTIEKAKKEFAEGKNGFVNLVRDQKRRPSFGEKYMRGAFEASHRSTCLRRHVGAVASKNNIFSSDGYNGAVRGSPHCLELGCIRTELNIPSGERHEMCRGVHAEQNTIINAGREGKNLIGATLHVTIYPCSHCAKEIVQSGIKKVFYLGGYNSELTEDILKQGKVKIEKFSGVVPQAYPRFWG